MIDTKGGTAVNTPTWSFVLEVGDSKKAKTFDWKVR